LLGGPPTGNDVTRPDGRGIAGGDVPTETFTTSAQLNDVVRYFGIGAGGEVLLRGRGPTARAQTRRS
jgi:hypothetical protein